MQRETAGQAHDEDIGTAAPTKKTAAVKSAATPRRKKAAAAKDDGQIAQVLRSVYQHAVDEDIPSEMLDLLNKLG